MISSTSEAEKPAIVIVPGSCAPPSFYTLFADRLREDGYETIVGALPTASREPPAPAATFEDDVAVFHAIVEELSDQNKQVVIVTHSYGGVVGTECVNGLAKTDREAAGKKGGVVQLVYLSSVVPAEGQSLQDAMADQLPDYFTIEGEYLSLTESSAKRIYSDLPLNEAVRWVAKSPRHSALCFTGQITYPAYRYVPVAYIVCERDLVIPPAFQREWIERMEEESGRSVMRLSLDTGHSPNASAPGDLVRAIEEAVGG